MLTTLTIRNIALIAAEELNLSAGFHALTGETGAGKSLLLDALGLALGARAESGLVRHGEASADVTAHVVPAHTPALQQVLEEHGLAREEGGLTLRRHIKREGPSKAWVNGTPVPVAVLAELAEHVVDVQAQHAHHALLQPTQQRDMADALAGLMPLRSQTAHAHTEWQRAHQQAEEAAARLHQAQAEAETVARWRAELDELAYQEGEEITLAAQRTRLQHFTQLHASMVQADEALSNPTSGSVATLRAAARAVAQAAKIDETLAPLATQLESARNEVEDAAHTTARALGGLESEGRLEQIDDRLHALKAAARKHLCTITELGAKQAEYAAHSSQQGAREEAAHSAAQAAMAARQAFMACCTQLTQARQQAATTWGPVLTHAVRALHLPHAELSLALHPLPAGQEGPHGAEMVEIMFAANTGHPAQGLGKVASGGELSRVLLALKSVLYQGLPAQTVVLDEIDTGLSGAAASAVGQAMARLAEKHQVLAITHHPQVAACAGHHWRITKATQGGSTHTAVVALQGPARLEELARLLSGNAITPQARAAAQALLAESQPHAEAAA